LCDLDWSLSLVNLLILSVEIKQPCLHDSLGCVGWQLWGPMMS
jgi:hypothetical protein